MTSLQDNEDVIVEIIKYLDIQEKLRLRGVCRKWYILISHNLSRTKVLANVDTKCLGYRNTSCSDYGHAITRSNTIEYSCRYDWEKFTLLLKVLNHFPQLTALYLHNLKIAANQISNLADFSFVGQSLSHLSFTACELGKVTRREWSYLCCKMSPKLKHLTLYQNKETNGEKLYLIKRHCNNLTEINYDLLKADSCLNKMVPDDLRKLNIHISDVPIARLQHMFVDSLVYQPNLTHLKLPCISMYHCHLKAICNSLQKLVCLEVPLVKNYHDHEYECGLAIGSLSFLESFTLLSFHFDVTDQDPPNIDKMMTQIIQRRGPKLKSLKIGQYSMTHNTFAEITSYCHNLLEFHYLHDDRCGYWGHRNLFLLNNYLDDRAGKLLANLESLRILNISYSVLTDRQIATIIKSLPNLRRLYLKRCKFAAHECLQAFIESARRSPDQIFHLTFGQLNEIMACYDLIGCNIQLPSNLICDCFRNKSYETIIVPD